MKLNKSTTSQFFTHQDGYQELVAHWGRLTADKEARRTLSASHHLLYLILRGRDISRAFTPVTNERKLANGATPYGGYRAARSNVLSTAVLTSFSGIINEQAVRQFVTSALDHAKPGYTLAGVA